MKLAINLPSQRSFSPTHSRWHLQPMRTILGFCSLLPCFVCSAKAAWVDLLPNDPAKHQYTISGDGYTAMYTETPTTYSWDIDGESISMLGNALYLDILNTPSGAWWSGSVHITRDNTWPYSDNLGIDITMTHVFNPHPGDLSADTYSWSRIVQSGFYTDSVEVILNNAKDLSHAEVGHIDSHKATLQADVVYYPLLLPNEIVSWSLVATGHHVPEPGGLILFGLGTLGFLIRRRSHRDIGSEPICTDR